MGRPAKDLSGQKFGRLTVLHRASQNASDGHARWICQCDCGKIVEVIGTALTRKKNPTQSCGCLRNEKLSKMSSNNYKDLTGQRFNRLVAKEIIGSTGESKLWRCECDCGNKNFITTSHHLISGNTQSCGCLTISIGEDIIAKILEKNNIIFETEKTFSSCLNGLGRFDFYLPEYNRLIEYDGIQHFKYLDKTHGWNTKENFEGVQQRDTIKNQWCKDNNISLVRIPYWERDHITLDMILGDQYLIK